MVKVFAEKICSYLDKNGRHLSLLLNDPIKDDVLEKLTSGLPIKLTKELKELYKWRNGTVNHKGYTFDMISFFPGFFFISLQEGIRYYNNFITDERWDKSWFPVFANGGGDFFVVKCSKDDALESSEVYGFMLNYGEPEIEYLNLTKMLETIFQCYTEGAYFINNEDYLDILPDKEAIISNKINPNLDRWIGEL